MSYSLDLRKKVLNFLNRGNSQERASIVFDVSLKTVTNWVRKNRVGSLSPKVRENKPRKIDNEILIEYLKKNSDAYLREIAEAFGVTIQAIFYACKRLRITLKKRSKGIKKEMKKKEMNL